MFCGVLPGPSAWAVTLRAFSPERARKASRKLAPTDVPEQSTCLPRICATGPDFGSAEYISMMRKAKAFVRTLKSSFIIHPS